MDIQSTNDANAPDASFPMEFVASFPIDFGVANDVDFYTHIPNFIMPQLGEGQVIEWYLKNNGTGQTIGSGWQLWVTPKAYGPHA